MNDSSKPKTAVSFHEALLGNFQTGESPDFKIKCKYDSFDVHKDIISGQSDVFGAACNGSFKEAITNEMDLSEDDPESVKAMLQFCYTADYDHELSFHAKVYATADKYNIQQLKDLCRSKFQKVADRDWSSSFFPGTISYIYDSTPPSDRGLRDVVIKICVNHLRSLTGNEEFENLLGENGEFAKDLFAAISRYELVQKYKCGSCQQIVAVWLTAGTCCPSCGKRATYNQWQLWKQS